MDAVPKGGDAVSESGPRDPHGGDAAQPAPLRRRFARVPTSPAAPDHRSSLEAEVVRLREENLRLKVAQHQLHNIGELLERTRSLRAEVQPDRGTLADDTAQMLVEGLVVRETLIELCQEMERSMAGFRARLGALASAADELVPLRAAPQDREPGGRDVAGA
jgi:hypothetical protein